MSYFENDEARSSDIPQPSRKPWKTPAIILATLASGTEKNVGGSDVSFDVYYVPNGAS